MSPRNPRLRPTCLWLLVLMLPLRVAAQEAGDEQPDPAALARAGRATLGRLETQAASWTATTHLAGGSRAVVEVVQAPGMRRSVLSIEAQGRRFEVLRIINRDGLWYVTEGARRGKYRPFEAPSDLPSAYFFLTRSEPLCITEAEGEEFGAYEGTADGVATYRTPLGEPQVLQLRKMLDEYETMKARDPDLASNPEMERTFERMRDLLEEGIPTRVEVASGLVVRYGASEKQTEIHDFRWLERVPPEAFGVEGVEWQDFTEDPTGGDPTELVMLGHNGTWRPGTRTGETDGRLLDLRTGSYRRIPFHGATVLPGCFLKDRRRVVVSGLDAIEGVLGLYEVDLTTGENRRLGGDLLASGMTLMPALSPDGTTLAVLHKGATGGILDTQVCLVDLKSGEARTLGEPRDLAFLSWSPNGEGLVLLHREVADPTNPTGPRTDTIARMDLEGRISKIREGSSPVLLADGETILFEDKETRTWQTCDLEGANVRPYAGGLSGYGFPSPSPDGERIMMMRFEQGAAPVPTILPIGEDKGVPATTAPGLWATPAWR